MSAQSSTRMKLLALVTALFIGGSAPQSARAKVATYSPDTDFSRMPSVVTWSPSTAKPLAEIERKAIDQRILDTQLQESRQQMEAELGGGSGSGSGGGGVLARVLDLVLTAAVYGVFDHVHHGPVSDFLAQHQDAAAAPTPPARAWHSVSPADAAKATMLAGIVSGVGFVAFSVWSALSQKAAAGAGAGAGGRSLWQGLRASIPVLSQRQARTAVPPAAGPEDEDAALALESGGGGFGAPALSLRAGGRASQLLTSDFPGPHFEVTSPAEEDAVAAAAAAAQRRAYYDEYVADLSSKRAAEEEALKSRASSTGLARDSGNAGLSGAESKDAGAKGNDYQRRLDRIGEAVRKVRPRARWLLLVAVVRVLPFCSGACGRVVTPGSDLSCATQNDAVVVSAAAVAKASQGWLLHVTARVQMPCVSRGTDNTHSKIHVCTHDEMRV